MVKESIRKQILIEYGLGVAVSDLSKKYNIARTTIYGILGKKSPKMNKLNKMPERVQVSVKKLDEIEQESNKMLAEKTVRTIMEALPDEIGRATIKDKILVLDRLMALYNLAEVIEKKEESKTEFTFVFKDTSLKVDEELNNT